MPRKKPTDTISNESYIYPDLTVVTETGLTLGELLENKKRYLNGEHGAQIAGNLCRADDGKFESCGDGDTSKSNEPSDNGLITGDKIQEPIDHRNLVNDKEMLREFKFKDITVRVPKDVSGVYIGNKFINKISEIDVAKKIYERFSGLKKPLRDPIRSITLSSKWCPLEGLEGSDAISSFEPKSKTQDAIFYNNVFNTGDMIHEAAHGMDARVPYSSLFGYGLSRGKEWAEAVKKDMAWMKGIKEGEMPQNAFVTAYAAIAYERDKDIENQFREDFADAVKLYTGDPEGFVTTDWSKHGFPARAEILKKVLP